MAPAMLANLVAYSAQVACLVAAAGVLLFALRLDTPNVRYGYWRALLALCLVLPLVQSRQAAPRVDATELTWTTAATTDAAVASTGSLPFADAATVVTAVLVGGVLVRLIWLSFCLLRLQRLRSAGWRAPLSAMHTDLQRALGTDAEIRYIPGLRQPATFGVRWPVVLLPDSTLEQPAEIQHAVLCHELIHVARRDWAWVLVEEVVLSILWFHPAVWWTVSRIQLAREEVVDRDAVRITGGRRTYIEALMTFADGRPLAPAAAFSRRRHLFRRILLVSKNGALSRRRLIASFAAMTAVVLAGSHLAIRAFPLQQLPVSADDAVQDDASVQAITASSAPTEPETSAPTKTLRPQQDTPRRGLEGTDALTRRLQQSEQPAAPSSPQAIATLQAPAGNPDRPSEPADPVVDTVVPGTSVTPEHAPSIDTASPEANLQPIRVGGRIQPPRRIKHVAPVYPPLAQSARVSGIVIVEITIGADGRVTDAQIVRSIPLLDTAALEAVHQWEFTPVLLNGAPVPIVMTVTVNFSLAEQ